METPEVRRVYLHASQSQGYETGTVHLPEICAWDLSRVSPHGQSWKGVPRDIDAQVTQLTGKPKRRKLCLLSFGEVLCGFPHPIPIPAPHS